MDENIFSFIQTSLSEPRLTKVTDPYMALLGHNELMSFHPKVWICSTNLVSTVV